MAQDSTFIVDCPQCKAKVAAIEEGRAERRFLDEDNGPHCTRLHIGKCPRCSTLLAGEAQQIRFENFDAEYDEFSEVVRIYPKPPKTFSSYRIPKVATESLLEAERCLQAGAHIAACAMLGRALEALCRDILKVETPEKTTVRNTKPIMLAAGIKRLKEKNIIDERLYNWSQELHAFRNLAAHPDEESAISRDDAEDLQALVYAITEYVYDLTDRYAEFKERIEYRKNRPSAAVMFASVLSPKAP
ncbi:MAG: DUF4145 domain-containing protein [Pseudolabrys sp.]|jgi:hypothetical protein